MLKFRQLESGTPPDIEVATDDAGAELAALTELFSEAALHDTQTFVNLDASRRGEDGIARFVVPGEEAGEIADFWEALDTQLQEWNAGTMARAEGIERAN